MNPVDDLRCRECRSRHAALRRASRKLAASAAAPQAEIVTSVMPNP
jgi:hypothetical protein